MQFKLISILSHNILTTVKLTNLIMFKIASREGEKSYMNNWNCCRSLKSRARVQSSYINSEELALAANSNLSLREKQKHPQNKSQKSQVETSVQQQEHSEPQNQVSQRNNAFHQILFLSMQAMLDIIIALLIKPLPKRVYFLKNQNEEEDLSLAISVDPSELDEEINRGIYKQKYFLVEDFSPIFKMEFDHRILIKFFKDKCFAKWSTVLWKSSFQNDLQKFSIFKREISHYGVECLQVKGDLVFINRTKSNQLGDTYEEAILQRMWENNKEEQSPLVEIKSLSIDLTRQEKSRFEIDGIFKEFEKKNKLKFIINPIAQERFILKVQLNKNDGLGNFLIGIDEKISFQQLQINNKSKEQQIFCQSIFHELEYSEAQFLEHATETLRKADPLSFSHFWNQNLPEKVGSLIRNSEVYNQTLRKDLILFVRVLEFKFSRYCYESCSLFENIYQGSQRLLQKLISYLKIKPLDEIIVHQKISTLAISNEPKTLKFLNDIRQDLSIETNDCLDNVFDTYYSESSDSLDLHKKILTKINNEKKVAPYLAERKRAYGQFSHHRDAFALISHSQIQRKQTKNRPNLLKEIQTQRLVEAKCIGCSSFFFHKTNILDGSIHQTPLKVFKLIQQMREFQSQIKNSICSMLNSKGGILLFSCVEKEQKIVALGAEMSQKEKEEHEQRFMSYVQIFEPKVQAKKSVTISFVPIVQDPSLKTNPSDLSTYNGQQSIFKSNEKYRTRSYLRAVFVMRIRVNSINPETVFFYKESNDSKIEQRYQNYSLSAMERGEVRSVKAKHLRKEIIKKMNKFYLPEKLGQNEKILARREESYFNHECRKPDTGISKSMIEIESKSLMMKKQSLYLTAVMILAKKENHQQIIKSYKKLGINVQIKVMFEEFDFSPAVHTAILYSNESFEKIYTKAKSSNQFNFKGRPLLLINITNYLKLTFKGAIQYFPQQIFLALRQQIKKIKPYEMVQAFSFEPTDSAGGKRQYYLRCQTHESSLFAYYYLNHHSQKLIFKNPLHFDKMDEIEQQKRMKQIFPIRSEKEVEQAKEEQMFKKKDGYGQHWINKQIQ